MPPDLGNKEAAPETEKLDDETVGSINDYVPVVEKTIDEVIANINAENEESTDSYKPTDETEDSTDRCRTGDGSSNSYCRSSSEDSRSSTRRGMEESDVDSDSNIATKTDDGWRLVRAVEGGPQDISLLTSYRGHVAFGIWNNKVCYLFKSLFV